MTRVCGIYSGQQLDESGFPRTIPSQQADAFAFVYFQVERTYGMYLLITRGIEKIEEAMFHGIVTILGNMEGLADLSGADGDGSVSHRS
jgi:hypothetical protein